MAKRTGRKARISGHQAETDLIKLIAQHFDLKAFDGKIVKELEAQIGSTRQFSKTQDNQKIDIFFSPDVSKILRSLAIQVKKKLVKKDLMPVDARELYKIVPYKGQMPVLVNRFKYLSEKEREMHQNWTVTMDLNDFLNLIKQIHEKEKQG